MEYTLMLLIPFFISLGFSLFVVPRILLISYKKHLFDIPDERKVHTAVVPRLGGVMFFPAIIFSLALTLGVSLRYGVIPSVFNWENPSVLCFGLCGLLLLYLTGIADDLIGLRYHQKFVIQICCAVLLVSSGLWINNLYGILGVYELSPLFGIPFSILIIVFLINAINLIDGIDGLASGLSGIALLFFTILFIYQQEWFYASLSLVTLGTILPFFYFNVFGSTARRRKIFMGDTGSLTIGFILSILVVRFSMYDDVVLNQTPNAIVVAFSLLIIPVFDVIRVMLHRLREGKNMFSPDKNHIHHKFLALGYSHRMAMIIILLISSGFGAMNLLLLPYLNINILLLLNIFIWTSMHFYISRRMRQKGVVVNPQ